MFQNLLFKMLKNYYNKYISNSKKRKEYSKYSFENILFISLEYLFLNIFLIFWKIFFKTLLCFKNNFMNLIKCFGIGKGKNIYNLLSNILKCKKVYWNKLYK